MSISGVDVVLITWPPGILCVRECLVNGERASFISLEGSTDEVTVITVEVDDSRVRVDEAEHTVYLDDTAVLLEVYGYRPDPWKNRVRLALMAGSITSECTTP